MGHENYIILFNRIVESINFEYFNSERTNNKWKVCEHNGNMVTYLRFEHGQAEELRINYTHDNYIRLVYLQGQLFTPATTCYDINVNMMVFYKHVPELIKCDDDYCMRKVFHNMDVESALGNLE